MLFYEEDDYLKALVQFSNLSSKIWLLKYFELYKSTLNWPVGLPPINRCSLISGTLREKFNLTYHVTLLDFEYKLDNEKQTLEII
jgi:hypothetical protein